MFRVGSNGKEGRGSSEPVPCFDERTCALCPCVAGVGDVCCVAELDSPPQQKRTRPVTAGGAGAAAEIEWNEELFL